MSKSQVFEGINTLFRLKHDLSVMLFTETDAGRQELIENSIANVAEQIHLRIKSIAN